MLNIIRHQRNAIQDHNKIPLHNLTIIKKIITTGENMEKSEHTYTADGNVKWIITLENSLTTPQINIVTI